MELKVLNKTLTLGHRAGWPCCSWTGTAQPRCPRRTQATGPELHRVCSNTRGSLTTLTFTRPSPLDLLSKATVGTPKWTRRLVSLHFNHCIVSFVLFLSVVFLTPGHAGRLPARRAAAYWHLTAEGVCEAFWPQSWTFDHKRKKTRLFVAASDDSSHFMWDACCRCC